MCKRPDSATLLNPVTIGDSKKWTSGNVAESPLCVKAEWSEKPLSTAPAEPYPYCILYHANQEVTRVVLQPHSPINAKRYLRFSLHIGCLSDTQTSIAGCLQNTLVIKICVELINSGYSLGCFFGMDSEGNCTEAGNRFWQHCRKRSGGDRPPLALCRPVQPSFTPAGVPACRSGRTPVWGGKRRRFPLE